MSRTSLATWLAFVLLGTSALASAQDAAPLEREEGAPPPETAPEPDRRGEPEQSENQPDDPSDLEQGESETPLEPSASHGQSEPEQNETQSGEEPTPDSDEQPAPNTPSETEPTSELDEFSALLDSDDDLAIPDVVVRAAAEPEPEIDTGGTVYRLGEEELERFNYDDPTPCCSKCPASTCSRKTATVYGRTSACAA